MGIGGGALRATFIDIDTAGDWLEHVRSVTSSLSESESVSSGKGSLPSNVDDGLREFRSLRL